MMFTRKPPERTAIGFALRQGRLKAGTGQTDLDDPEACNAQTKLTDQEVPEDDNALHMQSNRGDHSMVLQESELGCFSARARARSIDEQGVAAAATLVIQSASAP